MSNMIVVRAILLLTAITGLAVTHGNRITGEEAEEYDEKLSGFIREILENFRDQMAEGIPDVGIPAIDPLSIPNIDEDIQNGALNVALRLRQLNITGISKFDLRELKADLERGFFNFSVDLPELMAEVYCYMNGTIIGIFPINSDGPFVVRVNSVSIDGHGDLNVTTGGETRIHMNDLRLNLTFGELDVEFDSFLEGAKWAQTLMKILTRAGPKVFMYFNELAMNKINEALLTLINTELDKGTLNELLDLIPMPY